MNYGHFVTYRHPFDKIKYWNREHKFWSLRRSKNCEYKTAHGANVAAGKKRSDYSESELMPYIEALRLPLKE